MKRRRWFFFLFLLELMVLSGCTKDTASDAKSRQKTESMTFEDSLGNQVEVTSIERVGVCSGSLAHLWRLAGGNIIATTHDTFSYEPVTLSEDTIDLGDLKRVNEEQILASDLDLIIMSATIQGHLKLKDTLAAAGIPTAYFEVEDFEEYLDVLKCLTNLTGREDLYQQNGLSVADEVAKQMERKDGSHPRVLLLRALTTEIKVQNSDNMTGQMLKDLGCENIADSEQSLLDQLSLEAIIKEDPDDIFITLMGEEEQARKLIKQTIYEDPAWAKLRAVKEERCYILPKDLFHYKPNQRWGESYQTLADILYE